MARKIPLAQAGRAVRGQGARLSAELLAHEQRAFAAIDRAFAGAVRVVPGKDMKAVRSGPFRGRAYAAHDAAVAKARTEVGKLARYAQAAAMDHGAKMLDPCERALGAKYRNVARYSVAAVRKDPLDETAYWLRVFDAAVLDAGAYWREQFNRQLAAAANPADFALRLYSPTPISRKMFAGRGLVWRTASALKAEARAASIGASNSTIRDLMRSFNAIGDAR